MLEHIDKIAEVAKIGLDALPLVKELGKIELAQKDIDNADKPLAKNVEKETEAHTEGQEVKKPIDNKADGLEREKQVKADLKKQYPEKEGYEVLPEAYLRDKDGNIVKDPETGEARRIDFVVIKDGKVVDSVEVTSKTADKTEQSAKEDRIRDAGRNYVKNSDGELVKIPSDVKTRIERRV